jgi:hypothetical protein
VAIVADSRRWRAAGWSEGDQEQHDNEGIQFWDLRRIEAHRGRGALHGGTSSAGGDNGGGTGWRSMASVRGPESSGGMACNSWL